MSKECLSKNSEIYQSTFFCFCEKQIKIEPEEELSSHIKECKEYMKQSPLAQIFLKLNLKREDLPKLLSLRFEYTHFIDLLDSEIKTSHFFEKFRINEVLKEREKLIQKHSSSYISNEEKKSNLEEKEKKVQAIAVSALGKSNLRESRFDLKFLSSKKIQCLNCKKEFLDKNVDSIWYVSNCLHCFCRACLARNIKDNFVKNEGILKCLLPECTNNLQEFDYKGVLPEKYDQLTKELLKKQYNLIECANCNEKFEFIKGTKEDNKTDSLGNQLSKKLSTHYAENRCICFSCKTEQCIGCKAMPYHNSLTCKEFEENQKINKCRYCESAIKKIHMSRPPAIREICNDDECKVKRANACQKMLKCNHPCSGYRNEAECLPCLKDECAEKMQDVLFNQKGSDFCNICYVDGLINAPCVMAECGHIYHLHCIQKKLEMRWSTARINFTFCLCQLCQQWMELPEDCPLSEKMRENAELFEDIKKKSLAKLKEEGKENDDDITISGKPYFKKPMEYAISIYAFYECFKCKKPYFGGLKSCQEDANEADMKFDPKDLVCNECSEVQPLEVCPQHGKESIEYKCKFCCNVAQWFCWGRAHFCNDCHKRQCKGDYISKYPKEKLPKCPGKNACPLRIDHKPNGEEFALGCTLCKNLRANKKKSKEFE